MTVQETAIRAAHTLNPATSAGTLRRVSWYIFRPPSTRHEPGGALFALPALRAHGFRPEGIEVEHRGLFIGDRQAQGDGVVPAADSGIWCDGGLFRW